MKIIEPGHIYELAYIDDTGTEPVSEKERWIVFVNREDTPHSGTQTQEVLRALIDRTKHCHSCLHWEKNVDILQHLRMALALHESRALERKAEKGIYCPELINTGEDGHFKLTHKDLE